ncbi:hypothetical protein AWI43_32680 [Streptomyces sp. WAC04657]|uniref:hypothetical protein n=1 Tax=unclassified Streptomyces TaxID=2593676 RepID=UPI0007872E03|nr:MULTISPECIES: hypothetical protein [unclassified Streptomyces]KYG51190.1 hypothetical protein AWI43_32680 [Streptomyces sp. WAC04657]
MPVGDFEDCTGTVPGRPTRAVALATAAVLYALVVILQLCTPPASHIASVLVALPAVVAFGFRPPVIITVTAVAAGTRWALLPTEPERIGSAVGTTVVICVIAALGCFVVRRREKESARLWKVSSVASAAQQAVLRPLPEEVGRFRAAATYRAAAPEAV